MAGRLDGWKAQQFSHTLARARVAQVGDEGGGGVDVANGVDGAERRGAATIARRAALSDKDGMEGGDSDQAREGGSKTDSTAV